MGGKAITTAPPATPANTQRNGSMYQRSCPPPQPPAAEAAEKLCFEGYGLQPVHPCSEVNPALAAEAAIFRNSEIFRSLLKPGHRISMEGTTLETADQLGFIPGNNFTGCRDTPVLYQGTTLVGP
jgi:hypothetical protein